jgi:hypothetical protein
MISGQILSFINPGLSFMSIRKAVQNKLACYRKPTRDHNCTSPRSDHDVTYQKAPEATPMPIVSLKFPLFMRVQHLPCPGDQEERGLYRF